MTTTVTKQLVILVMLIAATAGPSWAQPPSSTASYPGFTPRLDFGFIDLGMSVAPRRPGASGTPLEAAPSLYRLADTEITTTDVGLDVRLRWPSPSSTVVPVLQPYVSFGPALAVPVGDDPLASTRVTPRPETPASIGMRGALGVTWQLSPDASLFGEYRMGQDPVNGRHAREADLFYGLNIKF